jgi:hypothetical protein
VTAALGAKQEVLTIVHLLKKLIFSCKEAVRFPFYFFFVGGGGIFKLDSYFLFKLKGCFLYKWTIVKPSCFSPKADHVTHGFKTKKKKEARKQPL